MKKNNTDTIKILFVGGKRGYKTEQPLRAANADIAAIDYSSLIARFFVFPVLFIIKFISCSPDILLTDIFGYPYLFCAVFSKIFRIPLIIRLRSNKYDNEEDMLRYTAKEKEYIKWIRTKICFALAKHALCHAAGIVTVSEFVRKNVIERTGIPGSKVITVRTPVDVRKYQVQKDRKRLREKWSIPENTKIISAVTGFDFPGKVRGLRKAMPHIVSVLEKRGDALFIIAGGGTLFKEFSQEIREYPRDAVRIEGCIENVSGLYCISDVFVHFSLQDGYPSTVLEAFASKLPVIVNRYPAMEEQVDNGRNGCIVDIENPHELEGALNSLLDSSELREKFGEHGFAKVERENSDMYVGTRLLEGIRSIVQNL